MNTIPKPIAGRRAPMPTSRGGGAAAVADGKIYVAGGGSAAGRADFAAYDPAADWTTLPQFADPAKSSGRRRHRRQIYVVGGRFEGGFRSQQTDAVEVFDPKTNQWSKRRSMLRPRGGVNGHCRERLFSSIRRQRFPSILTASTPTDYYNPVTDTWHRLENMPVAVHGVSGMAFIKGLIHFPGGATTAGRKHGLGDPSGLQAGDELQMTRSRFAFVFNVREARTYFLLYFRTNGLTDRRAPIACARIKENKRISTSITSATRNNPSGTPQLASGCLGLSYRRR